VRNGSSSEVGEGIDVPQERNPIKYSLSTKSNRKNLKFCDPCKASNPFIFLTEMTSSVTASLYDCLSVETGRLAELKLVTHRALQPAALTLRT
jgi:hypothetical protein